MTGFNPTSMEEHIIAWMMQHYSKTKIRYTLVAGLYTCFIENKKYSYQAQAKGYTHQQAFMNARNLL